MIQEVVPFEEKKLCTAIICNKWSAHPNELYSERKKVVDFFEKNSTNDFDFYGRWWGPVYKNYKGPVDKKVNYLKHYKFCFCYENIKDVPGYVTEKIFDCFAAACVPIYLGAPNVEDYIPQNCFIDRRKFTSDQQLYDYLKNMSKDQYEKYLTSAHQFLQSDKAKLFSTENFIQTFMNILLPVHSG